MAAHANSLALDANGDGRIQLAELKAWLVRWRSRTSAPAPAAPDVAEDSQAVAKPDVLPAVSSFGGANDWHLNAINAPEAWAAGYTGAGVTVAVIDTGADLDHRELRDRLWRNPGEIAGNGRDDDGNGFVDDVHGWDFVHNDPTPQDRNGHGTHVSSLIVAARDGTGSTGAAYGSQLMVLQGLGDDGVGRSSDVARAIRYAVDEGADIINVSLSGGHSAALESAIRYANSRDVLVVAAAGNQGGTSPNSPAALSEDLGGVISVGAYDANRRLAAFSNRAGDAVQIVAPGVRLHAATPAGYALYSGTSMAAPLVSGVAALALSASPNLPADTLRRLIVDGAASAIAGDDSSGAVNAATTVAQAAKWSGTNFATLTAPQTATRSTGSTRFVAASFAAAPVVETAQLEATPTSSLRLRLPSAPALRFSRRPLADRPQRAQPQLRVWSPEAEDEGNSDALEETVELHPEAVDASFRSWAA